GEEEVVEKKNSEYRIQNSEFRMWTEFGTRTARPLPSFWILTSVFWLLCCWSLVSEILARNTNSQHITSASWLSTGWPSAMGLKSVGKIPWRLSGREVLRGRKFCSLSRRRS